MHYPIRSDSAAFDFEDLHLAAAHGRRILCALEGKAEINHRGDVTGIWLKAFQGSMTELVKMEDEDGDSYKWIKDSLKTQYADTIADLVDEISALDSRQYDRPSAPVYL